MGASSQLPFDSRWPNDRSIDCPHSEYWSVGCTRKQASDTGYSENQNRPTKADTATETEANGRLITYVPITVSGKAIDAAGRPVIGATIYLVSTNNSPDKLLGSTITDAAGRFNFSDAKLPLVSDPNDERSVPFGTFELFGKSSQHAFAWQGMKFVQRNGPQDGHHFNVGDQIALNLLFDVPCWITGRFVDETGKPVAGVNVEINSCDYVDPTVENQSNDNFREFWAIHQARGAHAGVVSDHLRYRWPF